MPGLMCALCNNYSQQVSVSVVYSRLGGVLTRNTFVAALFLCGMMSQVGSAAAFDCFLASCADARSLPETRPRYCLCLLLQQQSKASGVLLMTSAPINPKLNIPKLNKQHMGRKATNKQCRCILRTVPTAMHPQMSAPCPTGNC